MSPGDIIRVPAGTLVIFEEVGIALSADRGEPEYGAQPRVTINTEEAPARDLAPAGSPILWVGLNDAGLYDRELAPLTDGHVRRIASEWHDGQASALYALASTGTITDETATEIRHTGEQAGDSLEQDELQRLLSYVFRTGERGPVGGWRALWDETPAGNRATTTDVSRRRRVRTDPAQVGTP